MSDEQSAWESNAALKRYVAEGVELGFENVRVRFLQEVNERRAAGSPPVQWHQIVDGIYAAVWWSRFTSRMDSIGWRFAVIGVAFALSVSVLNTAQDIIDASRAHLGVKPRARPTIEAPGDVGHIELPPFLETTESEE